MFADALYSYVYVSSAAQLFTDEELYNTLLKTVTELNTVLADVKRDPRRYTKGMIQVF